MPDRTGGERELSGNWRENISLNDPIIEWWRWNDNKYLSDYYYTIIM